MSEITAQDVKLQLARQHGIEIDDKTAGLLASEANQLAATVSTEVCTPDWESDPFRFPANLLGLRTGGR